MRTTKTLIITALSSRAHQPQDENGYADAAATWATCVKVHCHLGETRSADHADDLAQRCIEAATPRPHN